MNEKKFLDNIKEALMERFEKGTQIKYHEVRRNNNVLLQGLLIQKPESNIAPTIYMNAFYEMYQKGCSMEKIVDRIMEVYNNGEVKGNIDMEFFREFGMVRDRIVYRLVNAQTNQELLKSIPHILFLDLAICFYYAFYNQELGDGMILIHNSHMEMWNTNHQELMRLAKENTPRLFSPIFITLDTVMQDGLFIEENVVKDGYLYVLTNKQKNQGAACILYPDMMENIGKKLGGSYFVIPSSIHEVIILKDGGCENVEYLQEIIHEANNSQVMVEDVLSDHPYYYDISEKKLVSRKIVY